MVIRLTILLIGSCFFLREADAQKKDTLVFATYTYSTNNRLSNLAPLAEWLQKETGLPIKARSYPTVQALLNGILHDSVDLAMMNTSGYLTLQKEHPGIAIPALNLSMGKQDMTNYGGCIVAARSLGVKSIKELQSKSIQFSLALVNNSSTSGNLVPRLLLNAAGITDADKKFKVYYAGNHKKALQDVLTDKADLAGCGCAEVDSARNAGTFDEKAIVIGEFNDIPLGPVAFRKGTDKKIRQKIINALLKVHTADHSVFVNFLNGWTEFKKASHFRKINDKEYDSFRKLIGNNESLWRLLN